MLLLNRVKRDDRVFAAWSSRGLIWCIHKNSNVKINARLFETIDGALSRSNLGVTITSDLNWNKHINQTEGKANQTLGFVKRNIKTRSHNIKTKTYKALVRHRLEYCASVWDPHTQSAIQKMEMVQRRAARYVLKRYHNTSSAGSLFRQVVIPTGRYSDRSLFRQVDIPTNRSLFRQVVIPTGRYSDKQFVIPTGRYSDRSIVRQTGLYSDSSIVRQKG